MVSLWGLKAPTETIISAQLIKHGPCTFCIKKKNQTSIMFPENPDLGPVQ